MATMRRVGSAPKSSVFFSNSTSRDSSTSLGMTNCRAGASPAAGHLRNRSGVPRLRFTPIGMAQRSPHLDVLPQIGRDVEIFTFDDSWLAFFKAATGDRLKLQ